MRTATKPIPPREKKRSTRLDVCVALHAPLHPPTSMLGRGNVPALTGMSVFIARGRHPPTTTTTLKFGG